MKEGDVQTIEIPVDGLGPLDRMKAAQGRAIRRVYVSGTTYQRLVALGDVPGRILALFEARPDFADGQVEVHYGPATARQGEP